MHDELTCGATPKNDCVWDPAHGVQAGAQAVHDHQLGGPGLGGQGTVPGHFGRLRQGDLAPGAVQFDQYEENDTGNWLIVAAR